MKRHFKFLNSVMLLLAVILTFVIYKPIEAKAETYSGADDWNVEFNGSSMESTFKSTDIDDAIYKLQPGDTINITLNLKNKYTDKTDWYMTNKVLKSLEDTQSVAEGGAYTYVLKYIDSKGTEKVLYDSDEVGGETVNASGEGLHQATDSLKDYFYLDTLETGSEGKITLQVKLEGETQGNAYQDTLAQLQMNFAVELVSSGKTTIIKTGDTTNIMPYVIIALVSGCVCLGFAVYSLTKGRKDKDKKEDE